MFKYVWHLRALDSSFRNKKPKKFSIFFINSFQIFLMLQGFRIFFFLQKETRKTLQFLAQKIS